MLSVDQLRKALEAGAEYYDIEVKGFYKIEGSDLYVQGHDCDGGWELSGCDVENFIDENTFKINYSKLVTDDLLANIAKQVQLAVDGKDRYE